MSVVESTEAREASGLTSRLLLHHVEREAGFTAVEELLARCDLTGQEAELRDEHHWFSYSTKICLFEAAVAILDEPALTRRMGEAALDLNVGHGLKVALRSLGSPRLVYKNIVRANAKFNAVHRMELESLDRTRARVRYVDVAGVGFHRLDCNYTIGLMTCVPALFGEPPARVSHAVCGVDGADACIYDISWKGGGSHLRYGMVCGGLGASALLAAVALAPALVPAGAAVAAAAGLAAARRSLAVRRRRWRRLEDDLRQQSETTERLTLSLQDLAGELGLQDVLEKITCNVRAAVPGNQFALLVKEEGVGRYRCLSSSGLPAEAQSALESWAGRYSERLREPVVIDDFDLAGELCSKTTACPCASLCAAPLSYNGQFMGTLVALASASRTFLPRDVELLRSYAIQAAISLSNARLYRAQQDLASRDSLTGLLNHREFQERTSGEVARADRDGLGFSVGLIDLDDFKLVNDTDGHAEGDRLLRRAADELRAACRDADVAFRVGGDEIALFLAASSASSAAVAAERAAEAVAAIDPRIGASYGVATYPEDAGTKEELLAVADRRLYAMKHARKGLAESRG